MAAMAALAAGCRQSAAAAACLRAGLCALQQLCLQARAGAGGRSMAAGPWTPQRLPHPLPERERPWQQQAPACACQQRDAAVPWSLHQLLLPPQQARIPGSRHFGSSPPSSPPGSSGSGSGSSGPPSEQRAPHRPPAAAALQAVGWSRQELLNVPNALSLGRLLSGPLIASWILDGQWALALPALAVSGATDWADGWAARRFNQPSVIGSYLDPLADKVLICSVVGALGWSGVLPPAVVGIIVGRDVLLVAGAFVARAKSLGWRWPGLGEFFRVGPPPAAGAAAGGAAGPAGPAAPSGAAQQPQAAAAAAAGGGGPAHAAPLVKPLFISKVNTCFQLGLVGTCIGHAWLGVPGEAWIWAGSWLTAGTTVASCAAYLKAYLDGKVLAPSTGR